MKQLFAIVAVAVVLSSSVVVVTDAKPQHRHPISPVLNGTSTEDNDDIDCIEVEALKEYYCKTDDCKHFFTRTCYEVVNNALPTCATVKKCVEDRAEQYPDRAEKWHTAHVPMGSGAASGSMSLFLSIIGFVIATFSFNRL